MLNICHCQVHICREVLTISKNTFLFTPSTALIFLFHRVVKCSTELLFWIYMAIVILLWSSVGIQCVDRLFVVKSNFSAYKYFS